MARFLAMWLENERAATATGSCISLFRDSSDMIQLWIVGVGLYLTHDDLLLIELIGEVVHQPKSLSLGTTSVSQYRDLRVAPNGVCFEN